MEFRRDSLRRVTKQYRLKKGLSQEILSGLAGIPRSHLTAIESGKKFPNLETIWKLCAALEIPPHEFIGAMEEDIASYRGDK